MVETLEELSPSGVDPTNGRPGRALWTVLVLGTLRLNGNWDDDTRQAIATNHKSLRLMLGHRSWEETAYDSPLQTLKDTLQGFTPEVLDTINHVVVKAGQAA